MIEQFNITQIVTTNKPNTACLEFVYRGHNMIIKRKVSSSWEIHLVIAADGVYVHDCPITEQEKKAWGDIDQEMYRQFSRGHDEKRAAILKSLTAD